LFKPVQKRELKREAEMPLDPKQRAGYAVLSFIVLAALIFLLHPKLKTQTVFPYV